MAFDFKKEYKEFYMPKNKPQIVTIPKANYIAVRGKGNPNEEGGEYKTAIGVLYAVAYTLKMSYKTDYKIEGFFEYVVPPLEGFWWQDNVESIDYTDKSAFNWISVIRLPDFITKKDFDWAVETASKKKKMDCSGAEFLSIDEGLCVQIMHIGAFDDEPATVSSVALGKPVASSLAVLGEISIAGTLIKVDELANSLQVCLDSGAKKVLLPIVSAADIGAVPSDLIGCFNLIFYSSAEDAVYKALGVE